MFPWPPLSPPKDGGPRPSQGMRLPFLMSSQRSTPPIERQHSGMSYALLDPHQTRAAYLLPAEPSSFLPTPWSLALGLGRWQQLAAGTDSIAQASPVPSILPPGELDWMAVVTAPVPQDLRPPFPWSGSTW